MEINRSNINELVNKCSVKPDKDYGQNFLVEPLIAEKIVDALEVNDDYPLYLEEHNDIEVDTEYPDDIEEGEGEDEIYTGDIFEGLK